MGDIDIGGRLSCDFESLDDFIEKCIESNYHINSLDGFYVCKCLVDDYEATLLNVLKLESNKPSKYDLYIINYLNERKEYNDQLVPILEFYKNRL